MAVSQGYEKKNVTAKSIIHKASFVRGFNEVKKGIPFNYQAYDDLEDMEHYERGRLFGCVYNDVLKYGKKVSLNAQYALYDAFNNGSLI